MFPAPPPGAGAEGSGEFASFPPPPPVLLLLLLLLLGLELEFQNMLEYSAAFDPICSRHCFRTIQCFCRSGRLQLSAVRRSQA